MSEQSNGNGKKERTSTPAEIGQQMAEAGDVEGLWARLTEGESTVLNIEQTFQQMARALQVRSRQNLGEFCQFLFRDSLTFVSYLTLRTEVYLHRILAQHDRRHGRAENFLTPEIEKMLLSLLQLQKHGADLAVSQARMTRSRILTEQKRREMGIRPRLELPRGQGNGHYTRTPVPLATDSPDPLLTDTIRLPIPNACETGADLSDEPDDYRAVPYAHSNISPPIRPGIDPPRGPADYDGADCNHDTATFRTRSVQI